MAFISYTSFDFKTIEIVPVIASFDTEGHICPLYVRIGRNSFKINSYFVSSKYSNITEFRCKIADRDCSRPLSLTYYGTEGMWTIPRISPDSIVQEPP